ncbi:MAG TPA: RcnB family protein [Lysobacter sp.]
MKRILLASAMTALLLAGPAFAKNGHDQHGRQPQAQGIRIGEPHPHNMPVRHDNGRHLGQYKNQHKKWARGERLPRTYLVQRYYVNDYRSYRLAPPPRGMVWVRPYNDSNEFYLVQAATGLISQILGR